MTTYLADLIIFPARKTYFKRNVLIYCLNSEMPRKSNLKSKNRLIEAQYLTLLKKTSFAIKGYPYETSIAEKLHAMIVLDLANDRLKDFYDIWLIAHQFNVKGQLLIDAITNTFRARKTNIPHDVPTVFTDRFVQEKKTGWLGFKKKLPVNDPIPANFEKVLVTLRKFLIPPLQAAAEQKPFKMSWSGTKGWREVPE